MSTSLFNRTVLGLALASSVLIAACGSNGGGGTTNPPPPPVATAPAINLTDGATYNTAQTLTVTGAAGTTVHCTLDGSNPNSSSAPCPSTSLSTNGTTTVRAYASETGYTDSAVVTAKITINIPVAQTISLPATMTAIFNTALALNSFITASSSCPPSAVVYSLTSTDSNTTMDAGAKLASITVDTTGVTYGTLNTGNAPTQAKVGTFNFKATCGAATASSVLTVTSAKPTISSCTPSVVGPSGSYSLTCTGTNFTAYNANGSLQQWQGTASASNQGACPTVQPTLIGSTNWQSPTSTIVGFSQSGAALGPWNVSVINFATAIGTDGGWSCTPAIYTVTASGMVIIPGASNMVAASDPETGLVQVITNGSSTSFNVNPGAEMILATTDAVYVPQMATHSIARIDLATKTLSSIATPGYNPVSLAKDSQGNVYVAAILQTDSTKRDILRVSGGFVSKIASANGLTSFAASGNSLLWTTASQGANATSLHVFDTAQSTETDIVISRQANKVMPLSSGKYTLVYQGGATEASIVDLGSFTESGSASFSAGVLGFSGDYVSLFDGSIESVAVAPDGSGKLQLSASLFTKQSVDQMYAGFAATSANGQGTAYLIGRANGHLIPYWLGFKANQ